MGIRVCYLPISFQRKQSESHTFKTSSVGCWLQSGLGAYAP
jgi:hypothetical protein